MLRTMFDLERRTAVVTGGGHGIGRALAETLARRGASVVIADLNGERARRVGERIGGLGIELDVSEPTAAAALVRTAESAFGPVDVAVSNAGILDRGPDLSSSVEDVRHIVDVNLLAHVWLAQAALPGMVEREGGALIQTISSAALITGPSGMGYTFTKHGALGFAEWVALNYADAGIRVVCLCPNAVNTGMLGRDEDQEHAEGTSPDADLVARIGDVLEPEECASSALEALDTGRFLALPHPRVGESFLRKAQDYDAWLERTAARLRRMRGDASRM
jgi:NAD(P)-dependent dehydrogenase (short-subunit alcohol dehydrogenase family)